MPEVVFRPFADCKCLCGKPVEGFIYGLSKEPKPSCERCATRELKLIIKKDRLKSNNNKLNKSVDYEI